MWKKGLGTSSSHAAQASAGVYLSNSVISSSYIWCAPILQSRSYALAAIPAVHHSPTIQLLEQEAELIEDSIQGNVRADLDRRLLRFIRASANLKSYPLIKRAHDITKAVLPSSNHLNNALISAYAEIQRPEDALDIFEGMKRASLAHRGKRASKLAPRKVAYTSLLKAYTDHPAKARQVVHMLKEDKIRPSLIVFNAMINAHVKAGQLLEAEEVLRYMKSRSIYPDAYSYVPLIDGFLKQGDKDLGLKYLNEMLGRNIKPNVVVQTTIMTAHVKAGDPDKARDLLAQFRAQPGATLDATAYNTVIRGFTQAGRIDEALVLFKQMETDRVKPTPATYSAFLQHYVNRKGSAAENAEKVLALLKEMKEKDVLPDCSNYVQVIKALAMRGQEGVDEMIDEMAAAASFPRLASYTALLRYFGSVNPQRTERIWRHLLNTGLVLDGEAFDAATAACKQGDKVVNQALFDEVERVRKETEEKRGAKREEEKRLLEARALAEKQAKEAKETLAAEAWERYAQKKDADQKKHYQDWRASFEKFIVQPLREREKETDRRQDLKAKGMWPPPEEVEPDVDYKALERQRALAEKRKKREERQLEREKAKAEKIKQQDLEILGKMSKKERALILAAKEEEAAAKAAAMRKDDDDDLPTTTAKKEDKKQEAGPKGKKKKKAEEAPEAKAGGGAAAGGKAAGGGGGGGKGKK